MRAITRLLAIALVSLFFAGCTTMQTYPGPRLPKEKVALIKRNSFCPTFFYTATFTVTAINGVPPGGSDWDIEVLPGEYTLDLRMMIQTKLIVAIFLEEMSFTPASLTFNAEAGHTYQPDAAQVSSQLFQVWLKDVTTGAVVAGEKP